MLSGEKILVTGVTGNAPLPLAEFLARDNEVWGVARFSDPERRARVEAAGITTRSIDLSQLEPPAGPGQIVADISDTLEKKIASVRCYASQFPAEKEYIYSRIEAWAHRLGQAAGFEAGELFVSPRPLGTGDLLATALGGSA